MPLQELSFLKAMSLARRALQTLSKLFRTLEVLSIRSTPVNPSKQLDEAICVEPCTTEFIYNHVTFGLQFFPERRVIFGERLEI